MNFSLYGEELVRGIFNSTANESGKLWGKRAGWCCDRQMQPVKESRAKSEQYKKWGGRFLSAREQKYSKTLVIGRGYSLWRGTIPLRLRGPVGEMFVASRAHE